MYYLRVQSSVRPEFHRLPSAKNCLARNPGLLLLLAMLFVASSTAQESGSAATELFGRGVAISIIVRDASDQPISSSAVVKLFRGNVPSGQTQTVSGRAEFFVTEIGAFTAEVTAPGYASVQKDFSIDANGRAEVDVYLSSSSAKPNGAPGRALLAPKARKAVDLGLQALASDKLSQAQKAATEAMRLAPGHPDVLYLQGLVFLKQRDWSQAEQMLSKATQMDPSHGNAFAALGMAFCNQGNYGAAVAQLEKALQLNPTAPSWDTRWALAKAYYQQAHYDQALQMSQAALQSSNGKAPEIELLVAQSLTAVARYEDAACALRDYLREHPDRREAATARHWLEQLATNGKIHTN